MGAREFVLPDLGEGLDEAEIAAWLVKEGDAVVLNQPIVEVETAKATVEIPSPFAGIVAKLHAAAGETVQVGEPLVTLEVEATSAAPVAATPAVRKLARDLGVGLASVTGTGAGGRVTAHDVERAASAHTGEVAGEERVAFDVIPVSPVRRAIAGNLTRSVRDIPQVTTFRTVDCSALEAFRRDLGLSPLPIVVRALAETCRDHPLLNASFHPEAGEIHLYRRCDVGVATDTERGLLVPVVRDVASRGIGEVAAEIARLAEAARAGTISPGEVTGGTVTVTNTGSYGSEFGTPIIDPPQSAIFALGVIEPRALVVDGEVLARHACTLSLTFDHRLLDGRAAGLALGDLVDLLESPARLEALPR